MRPAQRSRRRPGFALARWRQRGGVVRCAGHAASDTSPGCTPTASARRPLWHAHRLGVVCAGCDAVAHGGGPLGPAGGQGDPADHADGHGHGHPHGSTGAHPPCPRPHRPCRPPRLVAPATRPGPRGRCLRRPARASAPRFGCSTDVPGSLASGPASALDSCGLAPKRRPRYLSLGPSTRPVATVPQSPARPPRGTPPPPCAPAGRAPSAAPPSLRTAPRTSPRRGREAPPGPARGPGHKKNGSPCGRVGRGPAVGLIGHASSQLAPVLTPRSHQRTQLDGDTTAVLDLSDRRCSSRHRSHRAPGLRRWGTTGCARCSCRSPSLKAGPETKGPERATKARST